MTEHERSTRVVSAERADYAQSGDTFGPEDQLLSVQKTRDGSNLWQLCRMRRGHWYVAKEIPDAPGLDAATVLAMWEREREREQEGRDGRHSE